MSNTDSPLTITVQVDLADNADDMREAVVRAAARQLLVQTSRWNNDEHFTEIANSLRDDISKAIKEEVEKVIAPAVAAALDAGVQPTDQYGEPRGEKTSLRAVIVKEAERALNKKVEVRDNYGRSESVVQQIIRDEVQRALADDLKDVIKAERARVTEAVRDEAAKIITDSVRNATLV